MEPPYPETVYHVVLGHGGGETTTKEEGLSTCLLCIRYTYVCVYVHPSISNLIYMDPSAVVRNVTHTEVEDQLGSSLCGMASGMASRYFHV